MRRRILSDEERDNIFNLEYSDEELAMYFTISNADLVKVSRINKEYNAVGYLLQKYILKSRGFTTTTFEWDLPKSLLEYVCKQICVDNVDLDNYSRTSRHDDLRSIMKEMGYKKFKLTQEVKDKGFNIAFTNRSEYGMLYDIIYYLRREKIALPSVVTLEKLVWDSIKDVEDYIYTKIVESVNNISSVESFLDVKEGRFSDYNIVKNTKTRGIKDIQTKIKILENYNLDIDLSLIPSRKLQVMYDDVVSCSREKILRFKSSNKRLVYIVIYIKQELKRLEDELIFIDRLEEKNIFNKKLVTKDNIVKAYNYFVKELDLINVGYSEGVLINAFLDLVTGKNKNKKIEIKKAHVESEAETNYIDYKKLNNFKDRYIIDKYTETEQRELIANSDKLKDLIVRKSEGEFYTSSKDIVDESHKMIEQELGVDWKSKYIVYECAAGKGNLTNEYEYKQLYSSSLLDEDLKYIQNGVSFQLDFLNDGIESHKIPSKLINALKGNKPIVLYLNPPYLANKAKSNVYDEDLGVANNLYTQFLIQILNIKKRYNLTNIVVAIFAPMTYMCGERYNKFRDVFLREFDFRCGFGFPAREFNSIYGRWSTSFCIWGTGECEEKNEFLVLQKQKDENSKITTGGITVLINNNK